MHEAASETGHDTYVYESKKKSLKYTNEHQQEICAERTYN